MKPAPKWLRICLKLTAAFLAVCLTTWLLMLVLMWYWLAKPPPLPPEAATFTPKLEHRGDRVYAGRSWFGKREGLPVLYLTGTAYEMGYANGLLTQKLIHRQEDAVFHLLDRLAPQNWLQFLIKFIVVFKNRDLPQSVIAEHQIEVLGLSRGCPDTHPGVGPFYHRLLNYHGAQDISYMMMNSPLLQRGCTSFGAWGHMTAGGHLLSGRNFDWEADPVFDDDRVLIFCEPRPQDGIAFVSLAWAGMVGCVSGMNREGISVSVNGAPSRLPTGAATPTCLVAREVLQHARNQAEAIAILGRRKIFVSSLFLVGSKKDGDFVIVEKTPERMSVRRAGKEDYLVCANHYLTPELAGDELNQKFQLVDTTLPRYARMDELVCEHEGSLVPADCADMLRDRRLPKGQFAGNGHRAALNSLIATHAVIMDLTKGFFWAAAPPHQLGKFVAFSIADPETILADETIPEDLLLADGGYQRYLTSQAKLAEGWQALKRKDYALASRRAREAETDNPGFYRNSWLLAEALSRQGETNAAARACQAALNGQPPFAAERRKLEQLAKTLGAPLGATSPVLQTSK